MSRAHQTRKGVIQHPKDLLHPILIVCSVCRGLESVFGPMPWGVIQRRKANPITTSHRTVKGFGRDRRPRLAPAQAVGQDVGHHIIGGAHLGFKPMKGCRLPGRRSYLPMHPALRPLHQWPARHPSNFGRTREDSYRNTTWRGPQSSEHPPMVNPKQLMIIMDAVSDAQGAPCNHRHHVWVLVEAIVDPQIIRGLVRKPVHKATDFSLSIGTLDQRVGRQELPGQVVLHLVKQECHRHSRGNGHIDLHTHNQHTEHTSDPDAPAMDDNMHTHLQLLPPIPQQGNHQPGCQTARYTIIQGRRTITENPQNHGSHPRKPCQHRPQSTTSRKSLKLHCTTRLSSHPYCQCTYRHRGRRSWLNNCHYSTELPTGITGETSPYPPNAPCGHVTCGSWRPGTTSNSACWLEKETTRPHGNEKA